jgi:hypothetical protein
MLQLLFAGGAAVEVDKDASGGPIASGSSVRDLLLAGLLLANLLLADMLLVDKLLEELLLADLLLAELLLMKLFWRSCCLR